MTYQPIWRDGQLHSEGDRDCSDRYAAIYAELTRIGEPFTVLDIGAAEGYFCARILDDFPTTVVDAIDTNPHLAEIEHDRLFVHRQYTNPDHLATLRRHDVILSLSVLHHFADWRGALDRMRQCRLFALIEVPHPDEAWMRAAHSRHQLPQIHQAVKDASTRLIGAFPRTGRDGSQHERPLYLVPGTLDTTSGTVFTGSGTNSRKMPGFSRGLDQKLGYAPQPGSLNLKLDHRPPLGPPTIPWTGRHGTRYRDYQFWDAWACGTRMHAMVPGTRGHGETHLELIAPHHLRSSHQLTDGDLLPLDYEPTRGLLHLDFPERTLHLWEQPGKIARCWKAGYAYEKPLLDHIRDQHYTGTAVDAGANMGNHTIWLAGVCGLDTAAFEPLWHRALQRNVDLNELQDKVDVHPVALGAERTNADHIRKGALRTGQGELTVIPLDDYQLSEVSVIKIDIEGMEPAMLAGAEKTIAAWRPDIYAEQWGDTEHDAIAAVLEPWEYEMVRCFSSKGSATPVGWWRPKEAL